MNIVAHEVQFGSHTFILNNQRSMFWPKHQTLILSDLHLGKTAHLRKNGFAIPSYTHTHDIQRLSALIEHYKVQQLVIVGDMIHAKNNNEVIAWKQFCEQHAHVRIVLIKGNHDRLSNTFLHDLGVHRIEESWLFDGVFFVHEPTSENEHPTISGHIHPGVQVHLLKNSRKSYPCFALHNNVLILPAFSLFTGLDIKTLDKNAKFYAFHPEGFFCL
ncbi:ligase-associated DNA damage response endonuclease PdeM [Flavobacterium sp. xlx-214]|uniref:ligase-associated DNA damage response endonuclease PdeM n=1 Tax=unclassified Flavobacterium TaxID=196869 RepID=UPI0013D263CA|nr:MULTISPECIES: ligase-associated DNA damage response endonuclease PdeM [unclassified Flavobacterium]MBA5791594.1 ligase-associated DNA damage response endonuclease PdeM [Flavobacterium sp. xlx-221]QMI82841.1 ligase-associated DNA damage response endonuclease PdeM [Flavobacterium sp. xlx-214]